MTLLTKCRDTPFLYGLKIKTARSNVAYWCYYSPTKTEQSHKKALASYLVWEGRSCMTAAPWIQCSSVLDPPHSLLQPPKISEAHDLMSRYLCRERGNLQSPLQIGVCHASHITGAALREYCNMACSILPKPHTTISEPSVRREKTKRKQVRPWGSEIWTCGGQTGLLWFQGQMMTALRLHGSSGEPCAGDQCTGQKPAQDRERRQRTKGFN